MRVVVFVLVAVFSLTSGSWSNAHAAESGFGVYLLGSRGGPGMGYMPPTGTYAFSQSFFYSGTFRGPLSLSGGTPESTKLDLDLAFDLLTPLWVTPMHVAGGQLAISATLPVGYVGVGVEAGADSSWDSRVVTGDPSITVLLGWHREDLHWAIGAASYIPAGAYDVNRITNLSLNRPAVDTFASATWLPQGLGLDLSGSAGVTFNGENPATQYRTGTELHLEATLTKSLSDGISVGAIAYHYEQLTDDSGVGARSGPFKGRVTAVGGYVGYDHPGENGSISVRLQIVDEFNVRNRFKGRPIFLTVAISPHGSSR